MMRRVCAWAVHVGVGVRMGAGVRVGVSSRVRWMGGGRLQEGLHLRGGLLRRAWRDGQAAEKRWEKEVRALKEQMSSNQKRLFLLEQVLTPRTPRVVGAWSPRSLVAPSKL